MGETRELKTILATDCGSTTTKAILILVLFAVSVAFLATQSFNPFIYFIF